MANNTRVTIRDVYDLVEKLETKIEGNYVSKKEFWPVKTLVYGFVTVILIAVIGAIVAQVVIAN